MRLTRIALLVLILFGALFALPGGAPQQTRAHQHWKEIKLYASYWNTERGFSSTLEMKNNRLRETLNAHVSIYFINGEEHELPAMAIAPRQTVVLDLNRVLDSLPALQRARLPKEGTVEVEYDGPNSSALMGSVSVVNPEKGIAWSFFLYPAYRGLSNAPLAGVFWLPTKKAEGVVLLHNTSKSVMTVFPALQVEGGTLSLDPVYLNAEQISKLNINQALKKYERDSLSAGGVELSYEGEPDALRAHGLLYDGRGFATQVDFNRVTSIREPQELTYHAPRFALGSADPALGLPRGTDFEPFLVLHNSADDAVAGEIFVSYRTPTSAEELRIPFQVPGKKTHVMELESYLTGQFPPDSHWLGMEVRYQTNRSSLAMLLTSLSRDRRRSLRSVMNWVQSTTREGWYWRADSVANTLVGIQNSGTEEGKVMFSLDYYVGSARRSYELPLTIPPRASHLVNIGEMIEQGLPDADGDVIPRNVSFGGYRAVKLHPRDGGPLTTEALHIDRKTGVLLSVYNTGCCETAWSEPPAMNGHVGLADLIETFLEDNCTGAIYYPSVVSYTSGNTSVATVQSSGAVNFVGVGSTSITRRVKYLTPWSYDPDTGEVLTCRFQFDLLPPCSVSVAPYVSTITPARGLIGTSVSISIQGNGFASGATVNAGSGITVTINSVSISEIQATFNISTSAPSGNHIVNVTSGGKTSNGVIFYVQVPSTLSVVSVAVLPDGLGPPYGCPGSQNYGIMIDVKYQVRDQVGVAILSSAMRPHETGIHFNGSALDSDIGPSGWPNSTQFTAADGTFHDVPLGKCSNLPISNPGQTATQNITMILPSGVSYAVRSQTLTVVAHGSSSFGHGTITNSVGDILGVR